MSNYDNSTSCAVALYSKRNCATDTSFNATFDGANATQNATDDLVSLSIRVRDRNKGNHECNSSATEQLHSYPANATGHATAWDKQLRTTNSSWVDNSLKELKHLIQIVGQHYKATPDEIEEMFIDTINEHSLQTALKTFRTLIISE